MRQVGRWGRTDDGPERRLHERASAGSESGASHGAEGSTEHIERRRLARVRESKGLLPARRCSSLPDFNAAKGSLLLKRPRQPPLHLSVFATSLRDAGSSSSWTHAPLVPSFLPSLTRGPCSQNLRTLFPQPFVPRFASRAMCSLPVMLQLPLCCASAASLDSGESVLNSICCASRSSSLHYFGYGPLRSQLP